MSQLERNFEPSQGGIQWGSHLYLWLQAWWLTSGKNSWTMRQEWICFISAVLQSLGVPVRVTPQESRLHSRSNNKDEEHEYGKKAEREGGGRHMLPRPHPKNTKCREVESVRKRIANIFFLGLHRSSKQEQDKGSDRKLYIWIAARGYARFLE